MRTMARTELCILIFLLLILMFGEVLKCTSAVCAVFMVKAKHATLAEKVMLRFVISHNIRR